MKKTMCAVLLAGALAAGVLAASAQALTITATQAGDRTISFSSDATGTTVWDFGDGTTGPAATTHTYASAGDKHVTLSDTVPDPNDPTGVATITTVATKDIHVYATPTASFTYSVVANGSIQFTDTSTGEPTSRSWSFPGGISSSQQNPVVSLASGSSVSLTVSNPAGSNTATATVTGNSPPVANFSIAPAISVAFGTTVTFTSTSTDPNTGDVLTYSWDFGDLTLLGTGQAATHTYTTPGTYQVTLTVSDGHGGVSSKSQVITVTNSPPVASFTVSPSTTTVIGTQLTFTSTSTDPNNDIATYKWSFDNGLVPPDGPVATTTFGDPGNYTVTLTVTDSLNPPVTTSQRITVLAEKAPAVSLSFSPASPSVGENVRFSASASDPDGTVSSIDWDLDDDGLFDDGTGSAVNTSFATPGEHDVGVRATDNKGVATIAFRTVVVTGSPAESSATASTPGSAPLSPQGSAPSPRRAPILSPFPIVRIRGAILRGAARINLLSIKAPVGAAVRVACHGRGCGKRKTIKQRVKSSKSVRIHAFERVLRRGTVLEVFVTEKGMVGKYTSFRIRSNAAPARNDLCLPAGGLKPTNCTAL